MWRFFRSVVAGLRSESYWRPERPVGNSQPQRVVIDPGAIDAIIARWAIGEDTIASSIFAGKYRGQSGSGKRSTVVCP
jgi:hypothetical protein